MRSSYQCSLLSYIVRKHALWNIFILALRYELRVLRKQSNYNSRNSVFDDLVIEGTYVIRENEKGDSVIVFTIESDDEDAKEFSGEFAFAKGEENGQEYIKINYITYQKNK